MRSVPTSHAGNGGSNPPGITMLRLQLPWQARKESLSGGSFFFYGYDVPLVQTGQRGPFGPPRRISQPEDDKNPLGSPEKKAIQMGWFFVYKPNVINPFFCQFIQKFNNWVAANTIPPI